MQKELSFFPLDEVQFFEKGVDDLISLVLKVARGEEALDGKKTVLLHTRFNGGFYIFESVDFLKRCQAFAKAAPERYGEGLLKEIFGIFEPKSLKKIAPDSPRPTEPTVVGEGKNLTGVWAHVSLGELVNFSMPPEEEVKADGKKIRSLTVDVPLRRTPHLKPDVDHCPPKGSEFNIEVYCDTLAVLGEVSEDLSLSGPPDQDEFKVSVFVSPCQGLEIKGEANKTLIIRRSEGKSESAGFRIAVTEDSKGEEVDINAYFFYAGKPCGRVTRIMSTIQGIEPTQPDNRFSAATKAPVADLTITVTKKSGTLGYVVKLTSPHEDENTIGKPEFWDLREDSQSYIKTMFSTFISKDPKNRVRELWGAGEILFKRTPQSFQDAYGRLSKARKIRTILVVSDEPYIPWELMVPPSTFEETRKGIRKDPLGVAHAIGRWFTGDNISPEVRKDVRRAVVVAPDYTGTSQKVLAQSAPELADLKKRFSDVPAISPNTVDAIARTLESSFPDLFHFVGHGNSSSDSQCLYLEANETLTPTGVLGELAFKTSFANGKPVVFLNACELGQQILALGGPGGFVPTFISLYACCVVAPLWSVRDVIAHEVATALYDSALRDGGQASVAVAEVLRTIRKKAYAAGEDSYAAYCFFGDPNFVLTAAPTQSADKSGS